MKFKDKINLVVRLWEFEQKYDEEEQSARASQPITSTTAQPDTGAVKRQGTRMPGDLTTRFYAEFSRPDRRCLERMRLVWYEEAGAVVVIDHARIKLMVCK